jgi:aspartyl-tRNA(Asn)/glutamyl-tRNA(Gln) amidotransferase subunit C
MEEKDFDRLLEICRLKLDEKEKESVKKDIEDVIKYFEILGTVDTDGIEPAYHPIETMARIREDLEIQCENQKELLDNTKTFRFYVVGPKV